MQDTEESIALAKKLYDRYRRIFKKQIHIDHHPGWYPIIEYLTHDLYELSLEYSEGSINVECVRDKMGGLRYYVEYHLPDEEIMEIEKLIRKYEKQSLKTCEECGESGSMCSPKIFWFVTLCAKCRERYGDINGS